MRTLHAVVMWICLLCPALFSYTLTIAKAGTGDGQVRVNGVLHSLPYSENFAGGVDVTVRAFPASGSSFDHWSWSTTLTSTLNPITLPMPNQNIVVYAHFNISYTLSIIKSGPGDGQVIANGGTYSLPVVLVFDEGTTVTLEAVADDYSVFYGWFDDLNGSTNPTSIVMNTDKSVQVDFGLCPPPRGYGISFGPINYIDNDKDGVCQYALARANFTFSLFICPTYMLNVHLTWAPKGATAIWGEQWFPESGYYEISPVNNKVSILLDDQFLSQISKLDSAFWKIEYTITYSSGSYYSSSFEPAFESEFMDNPLWHAFSIAKTGSGSGKVKVNSSVRVLPYSEQAHEGAPFHLAAIPDSGSVFSGWSGAVTSTNSAIDVSLDSDKVLNAKFDLSQPCGNMLKNGEFSDGASDWLFWTLSPAAAIGTIQNGEFVVTYTHGGDQLWHVQLVQWGLLFENGRTYHVFYDAYASADKIINIWAGKVSDPWTSYSGSHLDTITTIKTRYNFPFTMNNSTDPIGRLAFDVGLSTPGLHLDNVVLIKQTHVTFTVQVPGSTPAADKIYLAGNFNYWDPGPAEKGTDGQNHDVLMQKVSSNTWQITMPFDVGTQLEYKYTRGSWSQREQDPSGGDINNLTCLVPCDSAQQNDIVAKWSDVLSVDPVDVTSINDFQLLANYPNPFNSETRISYELPYGCNVRLAVYDMLGHEVKVLVNDAKSPGMYEVNFNAGELPSGVYFYKMTATGVDRRVYQLTKKLMLTK
jgi:hypothetical protein